MAETTGVLNGTNLNRDEQFQAISSQVINEGVQQNFANECEVTLNQVDTGQVFLEVTRTNVAPNETFLVPVWIKNAVVVDTTGTGWVIVRIPQAKINDGSSNNADGTGIAVIEEVAVLPADPYIILATLAIGVITDVRNWARISDYVIPEAIHYDEDTQANDTYVITIAGVTELVDGDEFVFKANTVNTGACTLNVNGLGAKIIKKKYNADTDDGDIPAGAISTVRYDADNDWFQMTSTPATITSLTKANQAEAEAGTNDDKYMTSLKTKQSIDFNRNIQITCGEDIDGSSTPQAAFISKGTADADATIVQSQITENNADKDVYGVNFYSQTMTMSTFEDKITRIDLMLMEVGNPAGNFRLRIYAVDGAHKPTGAVLAEKTVVATNIGISTLRWTTFTLASALTVSPGTEYAIVVDAVGGDAANYVEWQIGNGNTYSGGVAWSSADAGSSWSAQADDFAFRVWSYETQTAGELYQSKKDEPFRGGIDGFVVSNTLSGNSADFRMDRILDGFVGLTKGETYHVDATLGEITTSVGGLKVGKAVSDTELEIDKADGFIIGDKISKVDLSQAATDINELYVVYNVGFKPSKVDLHIQMYAMAGAGSNERWLHFNGVYRTNLSGTSLKLGSTALAFTENQLDMEVTSLTLIEGGATLTTTLSNFEIDNSGFKFKASVNSAGAGGCIVVPVFYR